MVSELLADGRFWLFAAASALLLGITIGARIMQWRRLSEGPARLEAMLGQPVSVEGRRPYRDFDRNLFWSALGTLALLLALHPFVYEALGLPIPYLITLSPESGALIHALMGVALWAPAVALTIVGLLREARFARMVATNLDAATPGGSEDPLVTKGLVRKVHLWFFQAFQEGLLHWGLVGGLAVASVVVARPEWWVRITASLVVAAVVGWLFIVPIVRIASWVAANSRPRRRQLENPLVDAQVEVLHPTVTETTTGGSATAVDLRVALDALPSGNAWAILWDQTLRSMLGMVGPFLTVLHKVILII